jgi:hypothetical protein
MMNLNITELNNTLKSVRFAPRSGGLEDTALNSAFPSYCMCANRYGATSLSAEGAAQYRTIRGYGSAAFATLGR